MRGSPAIGSEWRAHSIAAENINRNSRPQVLCARQRSVTPRFLASLLLLLLLPACEGAHLYSAAKDTLATGIKTEYDEATPEAVLETHKKNLESLAQAEREATAEGIMFERDVILWHIANGRRTGGFEASDQSTTRTLGEQVLADFSDDCVADPEQPCVGYATRRLVDLGITSKDELRNAIDALTIGGGALGPGSLIDEPGTLVLTAAQLTRDRRALQALGWQEVWDCKKATSETADTAAAAAGISGPSRIAFNPTFERYQADCEAHGADEDALASVFDGPGILGDEYDQWMKEEKRLDALKKAREDAAKEVNELKKGRIEAEEATDKSFVESAQAAAEKLAKLLKESGEAEEIAESLGFEEVIAEARLDDLALLLNAVHASSLEGLSEAELAALEEDPGFKRAAVLAAGLPGLANKVENVLGLLRGPAARTDLLIQLNYQKARIAYLKKRTGLIEERAGLRQALLRAYLREADLLYRAQLFAEHESVRDKTLNDIMRGSNAAAKERAYQALIAFDHAISVARRRSTELRTDLASFGTRERLIADEYGIEAWSALLGGPIGQLQAYHKAGIKPEAVAEALAGLASLGLLGAIAVGVN